MKLIEFNVVTFYSKRNCNTSEEFLFRNELLWLLPPIGGEATYVYKMSEFNNSDLDPILTRCFPVLLVVCF